MATTTMATGYGWSCLMELEAVLPQLHPPSEAKAAGEVTGLLPACHAPLLSAHPGENGNVFSRLR